MLRWITTSTRNRNYLQKGRIKMQKKIVLRYMGKN